MQEVFSLQRKMSNNVTPVLLMTGHWIEILGWWALGAAVGSWLWVVVVFIIAGKFRQLQELSHFGVHRSLCRSARVGDALIEFGAHAPLALQTVSARRRTHVREHHPAATISGRDPNLADLERVGLTPGCTTLGFILALFYPLSPWGLAWTCKQIVSNLWSANSPWWRPPIFLGACTLSYLIAGWPGIVFSFLLPRLLVYPQLSWLSLLVEHRWFDAAIPRSRRPLEVESSRCQRLYLRHPALAIVAKIYWLPYGDLFHFTHSVHPAVRWSYLPAVERVVGLPQGGAETVLLGRYSAVRMLYESTRAFRALPTPVFGADRRARLAR